jgi:Tfp pilus assembly protein PilP
MFKIQKSSILILILLSTYFAISVNAQTVLDVDVKSFEEINKSEVSHWGKDPFSPTKTSMESLSVHDIQLNGVVYNSNEAYALIDGFMVKKGDMIGDFRVVSIKKDHVVFRKLDEVKTLHLAGGL